MITAPSARPAKATRSRLRTAGVLSALALTLGISAAVSPVVDVASARTVTGGAASENIKGTTGNDSLRGGGGDDVVYGYRGNDHLDGQEGRDLYLAGPGRDAIYSRDGVAEKVFCGRGRDAVTADANDETVGCERVGRPAATPPPGDAPTVAPDPSATTPAAAPPEAWDPNRPRLSIGGLFNPDEIAATGGLVSVQHVYEAKSAARRLLHLLDLVPRGRLVVLGLRLEREPPWRGDRDLPQDLGRPVHGPRTPRSRSGLTPSPSCGEECRKESPLPRSPRRFTLFGWRYPQDTG